MMPKTLAPMSLTDEEIYLLLRGLELLQQTRRGERAALELPPLSVAAGEPLPPINTRDGELLRANNLHQHLTAEALHRSRCQKQRRHRATGTR